MLLRLNDELRRIVQVETDCILLKWCIGRMWCETICSPQGENCFVDFEMQIGRSRRRTSCSLHFTLRSYPIRTLNNIPVNVCVFLFFFFFFFFQSENKLKPTSGEICSFTLGQFSIHNIIFNRRMFTSAPATWWRVVSE
jgi:hypothetical protein